MKMHEDQNTFIFNQNRVPIEELFKAIIDFNPNSQKKQYTQNTLSYMDVYDCYYICSYISALVIEKLEMSQLNTKRGCDIVDFVRVIINVIPHRDVENLYVAIGIIDLFREITQAKTFLRDSVRLQDLTDFVCEKYKLIYKDHITNQQKTETIKEKTNLYPIEIFYDVNNKNLIISTIKDIRFLNIVNGGCKIMFESIFDEPYDEITVFRTLNFNKQAIVGNQRGELNLYDLTSGEKISSLNGHANDINQLQIDYVNKMIVTSGYDLTIMNQLIAGNKFEVKRKITNSNFKKIVTIMELSVHHNLLVTCSDSHMIYLWDYEFNRLIASIQLESKTQPTCMCFINGLSIIFIGTSMGDLYMISFEKNETLINLKLLGCVNLKHSGDLVFKQTSDQKLNNLMGRNINSKRVSQLYKTFNFSEETYRRQSSSGSNILGEHFQKAEEEFHNPVVANKIIFDCQILAKQDKLEITSCQMYLGLSKGDLATYNLTKILNNLAKQKIITYTQHANQRQNYNPYRSSNEDFLVAHSKTKIVNLNLSLIRSQDQGYSAHKGSVFLTSNSIVQKDQKSPQAQFKYKLEHLESSFKKVIRAHSKKLTVLNLINLDKSMILTSSSDSFIILWDVDSLDMVGQVNINQNEPKYWRLLANNYQQYQKKILFALKTIEVILNKYTNEMSKDEYKIINVNKLLEILIESKTLEMPSQQSIKSKQKYFNSPMDSVSNRDIDEPYELQKKLNEQSEMNKVYRTNDAEIFHFLNANYRDTILKPYEEPPKFLETNNAYQRLVRQLGRRDKLMQNVIKLSQYKKSKPSSQNQIKLQQPSVNQFRSIANVKIKDSDSDHSLDRSKSGDIQPSRSNFVIGKITLSNFYNYASTKKLIKTQNSELSQNTTQTQLYTNKKVFGEVLESLQRNKKIAQKGQNMPQKITSQQDFLTTPTRKIRLNSTLFNKISTLERSIPIKDQTIFEQKMQLQINRTKSKVSNMLNDISAKNLSCQTPDSFTKYRFVSDPEFGRKLSFASTNGFNRVFLNKIKQFEEKQF